jgi:uncharacterized protein
VSIALPVLFFVAAVLYSSVGHAGASGYLAAMAFSGLAPAVMKPTALVLNLLVASIATLRFYRAGHFSWALLWPFALGSIPLAFVGGALHPPGSFYKPAVGVILLFAATRLLWSVRKPEGAANTPAAPDKPRPLSVPVAVLLGGLIGLLSGLTGTGGGIFLSPLLLFLGWAETRRTAGVSAAFILVNSAAGLAGNLASVRALPGELPLWAGAVVLGGLLGAELGSRRLPTRALRAALSLVLIVAGFKLILT